ncbi:hypothetical protein CQW23_00954 [Capsicum baccatum]|uniref:Uncharacterized protein n=1 Tax=Capsicum baccatum TaxID=33114 RepID=A0A2G2XMK2_CAPBA|nr:hypothetical protein CQW23_00954 [Capsicum baccatum]
MFRAMNTIMESGSTRYKVIFTNIYQLSPVCAKLYTEVLGSTTWSVDIVNANGRGNISLIWTLSRILVVFECALFYLLNIYKIRIVEIAGYGLLTNFPCITAFIVFGNPQGLPLAGYWLEKIARGVSNTPEEIRDSHLIGQGSDGAQLENGAWWGPWNDVKSPHHVYIVPNALDASFLSDEWRRCEHDKVLIGDGGIVRNSAKVEDRLGNIYPSLNKFAAMISMLLYPNLEDTVLFQDGGIVVDQVDFVRAYGLEVVIGADSVGIIGLTKIVTMELHDLLPQCLAMIITVILIARISSCLDTAGLSEVHAPYLDNYVAKSYFSKHDNLIDSKFEDFIAHDILSSGCISLQGNVEFPPKLTFLHRKLIGEGSHRRLSSSLRLKMSSESFSRSSKSFEVIIVERLPSGVFADPFELQHLVQRGVFTDAAVFGDTNLELPSFLSNRSLVEVHLEVNSNLTTQWKHELELNMELPLHSRYQVPHLNNNNNNNKPSVFPPSGVWGGKMYAVHTSTSEEVERLFPIDPRLKTVATQI